MELRPSITLEGSLVRLEPLAHRHASSLHKAARAEEIWHWLPLTYPVSRQDIDTWIESSLQQAAAGLIVPFAIIFKPTESPIGSTRYMDIVRSDQGLEIGWTWLNPAYWRSSVNSECKFQLLQYAFETLGAIRVAFRTDLRNIRSQAAIERIGAIKEGVLRSERTVKDQYRRWTVTYSIIDEEWPTVKQRLHARLGNALIPSGV
ncbi:MAG: family N-acetyltransferase [Chloroflexi bacterium]|nr:family N-acetyltransferase [Chloroflexota bacterium]